MEGLHSARTVVPAELRELAAAELVGMAADKPAANPSSPSVMLTAFEVPTSKNKMKSPYVHFKSILKLIDVISRSVSPPLLIYM